MMMPRSLSGLQSVVAFKVVAWLLPDQPPPLITLVWGSSAPSVIRKTYGSVLFEALPSPTLVISVLIVGNAFSKWVPPEPRLALVLVSSCEARFAAA